MGRTLSALQFLRRVANGCGAGATTALTVSLGAVDGLRIAQLAAAAVTMALAYDAARVTRDVDARFVPHGIVLDEARQVASDLGLPPWWLNEQATAHISDKDDPGALVRGGSGR
jgi:sorbitol-specific phosphotransferase system component IIBC